MSRVYLFSKSGSLFSESTSFIHTSSPRVNLNHGLKWCQEQTFKTLGFERDSFGFELIIAPFVLL